MSSCLPPREVGYNVGMDDTCPRLNVADLGRLEFIAEMGPDGSFDWLGQRWEEWPAKIVVAGESFSLEETETRAEDGLTIGWFLLSP